MKKKRKQRKVEKKQGESWKKNEKIQKLKIKQECTMDYCCNPH